MQVIISPMTEADLEQVLYIEQNSFSSPWSRNSFFSEITRNNHAYYVVARLKEGAKVIGYGGIWIIFDEAHITTLAVHPHFRQAGVGSFLLNNLVRNALLKGVGSIFLEVRDSNQKARNLYEKFNFKVVGRRKKYYHDEDALIMKKIL